MQSIEHVIEFSADGAAECLHTDSLPLGELGKLSMRRASTIEWNEHFQFWEVHIDGKVPFGDPSREACLTWERYWFNGEILNR